MDLNEWENCPIKYCKNKVCTWLGEGNCYPHTLLTDVEKKNRYKITHDNEGYLYTDYGTRLIRYLETR